MDQLKVENTTKVYDGETAIKNVSFKTKKEELIVLLGPSGCGKTTTLRLVAGLEMPTSGKILFDGEDVSNLSPAKRNVAMAFQDLGLYPHLSVRENMSLCLKSRDYEKEKIEKKVQETAEMLDIENLLDRNPKNLSGGQAQRVALGRALVRDPELLLLDEPLSSLDEKMRVQMRPVIKEIHRKVGITTIHVTHNQEEAMDLADRIILFSPDGTISQKGPPEYLYNHPINIHVATFIGSPTMNLIEGKVVRNEGIFFVSENGIKHEITQDLDLEGVSRIKMGIRPEDISLVPETDEKTLEASISTILDRQNEKIVRLDINGEELTAKISRKKKVSPEEKISIKFSDEAILYFDDEGSRISD